MTSAAASDAGDDTSSNGGDEGPLLPRGGVSAPASPLATGEWVDGAAWPHAATPRPAA